MDEEEVMPRQREISVLDFPENAVIVLKAVRERLKTTTARIEKLEYEHRQALVDKAMAEKWLAELQADG